jgi:hypothetical protein
MDKGKLHSAEDNEWATVVHSAYPDVELKFVDLERLSSELRTGEFRKQYILFGDDVPNCTTCKSDFPLHALFIAPLSILTYLVAIALIGAASQFQKKTGCRSPALVVLTLAVLFETATLLIFDDEFSYPLFKLLAPLAAAKNYYTRVEQMSWIRSILIAAVSLLVLLIDIEPAVPKNVATIKAVIVAVESAVARLQTARLARMAVMQDDTLRRHCWEKYRVADREHQHLFGSVEYKNLQADLARKYRIEEFERAADASIKATLEYIFQPAPSTQTHH